MDGAREHDEPGQPKRGWFQNAKDLVLFPVRAAVSEERAERLGLTSLRTERFEQVLARSRGRLVDIGCEWNLLAREYRARTGAPAFGLDVHLWAGVHVLIGGDGWLPLLDRSVDTVTIVAALNHVERRSEILREVARILRPGGRLIVTMIDPLIGGVGHLLFWRWWDPDMRVRGIRERERWRLWPAEVRSLIAGAGLCLVQERRFVYGLNRIFVATRGN